MSDLFEIPNIEKDILAQRMALIEVEEFLSTLEYISKVTDMKNLSAEEEKLLFAAVNPRHMDIIAKTGALESAGNLGVFELAGRALRATYEFFRNIILGIGKWLGLVDDSNDRRDNETMRRNLVSIKMTFSRLRELHSTNASKLDRLNELLEKLENNHERFKESKNLVDRFKAMHAFKMHKLELYKFMEQEGNLELLKDLKRKDILTAKSILFSGANLTQKDIIKTIETLGEQIALQHSRVISLSKLATVLNKSKVIRLSNTGVNDALQNHIAYINHAEKETVAINEHIKLVPLEKDKTSKELTVLYFKTIKKGEVPALTELDISSKELDKIVDKAISVASDAKELLEETETNMRVVQHSSLSLKPLELKSIIDALLPEDKNLYVVLSTLVEVTAGELLLLKTLKELNNSMLTSILSLPTEVGK